MFSVSIYRYIYIKKSIQDVFARVHTGRIIGHLCSARFFSVSLFILHQILLLCTYPFYKKLQTQTVSKETLRKTLSCEKGARKMLVKLTPCV